MSAASGWAGQWICYIESSACVIDAPGREVVVGRQQREPQRQTSSGTAVPEPCEAKPREATRGLRRCFRTMPRIAPSAPFLSAVCPGHVLPGLEGLDDVKEREKALKEKMKAQDKKRRKEEAQRNKNKGSSSSSDDDAGADTLGVTMDDVYKGVQADSSSDDDLFSEDIMRRSHAARDGLVWAGRERETPFCHCTPRHIQGNGIC